MGDNLIPAKIAALEIRKRILKNHMIHMFVVAWFLVLAGLQNTYYRTTGAALGVGAMGVFLYFDFRYRKYLDDKYGFKPIIKDE